MKQLKFIGNILAIPDYSKINAIEVYCVDTFRFLGLFDIGNELLKHPYIQYLFPETMNIAAFCNKNSEIKESSQRIIEFELYTIHFNSGRDSKPCFKVSPKVWSEYLSASIVAEKFK